MGKNSRIRKLSAEEKYRYKSYKLNVTYSHASHRRESSLVLQHHIAQRTPVKADHYSSSIKFNNLPLDELQQGALERLGEHIRGCHVAGG